MQEWGVYPLPDTPDRTGALALSSLPATLMTLPASVANKRLNLKAKLFRCNTYKKPGGGGLLFSDIQTFGL